MTLLSPVLIPALYQEELRSIYVYFLPGSFTGDSATHGGSQYSMETELENNQLRNI